jgi:DNA repair protein RadA/Sms
MNRNRTHFVCEDSKWAGRCPGCGAWNTLTEVQAIPSAALEAVEAVELGALPAGGANPIPTGVGELDRVLGGGLIPSSVTLVAGEPGIGKSTLLLQMLCGLAAGGRTCLLVSAEESPAQVRDRAARLGALQPGVWVAAQTELPAILDISRRLKPDVLVVDSVQTVSDPDAGSSPGTVGQVRACAQSLAEEAKRDGPAVVLVGHVTKDGAIAGPRALEHLVDTVLTFEGDRHHALRLLRAVKHRFGAVGELGLWEMTSAGLVEVADAGALLLADRQPGSPGSAVFAAMEGRRPLLVEIQALVVPAGGPPRRSASGYDLGRLCQVLAVLHKSLGLSTAGDDVYVSAVGGVKVGEPAADLAVALAVVSAVTGFVVPDDMVAIGEVGLGGELRKVAFTPPRLAEAERHGFSRALIPPGANGTGGLRIEEAGTLALAVDSHLAPAPPTPRLRVLAGRQP